MQAKIFTYFKILLGIAAGPGLLLVLPFLLNSLDYGRVFGFIAVVQLLSLFSSLGLEIVAAREKFPIRITFLTLTVTTFLATIAYEFTRNHPTSFPVAALAFGTALANNISLVIQNGYLFNGEVGLYARFGTYRAVLLIITLLVCIRFNIDVESSWAVASIVSLLVPHILFRSSISRFSEPAGMQLSLSAILNIYYVALPMAILNSLASLPFITERIIAKAAFDPELFPKYAICATLMTPMAYLGNMTQNYLLSNNERITDRSAIGGAKLLLILCGGYVGILFSVGVFVLPPYFNNQTEFFSVALPCALWVIMYCVVSFPLAAITQKQAGASSLAKCAFVSALAVLVLYGCYQLILGKGVVIDLPWKTSLVSAILSMVIIITRWIYVWPLTKLGAVR